MQAAASVETTPRHDSGRTGWTEQEPSFSSGQAQASPRVAVATAGEVIDVGDLVA